MIKFDIKDVQKEMTDKYITHFKNILDDFFRSNITDKTEMKAVNISLKDGITYVMLVDKSQLRLNYQHLTDRLPTFEDKIIVSSNNVFLIDTDKLSDPNLFDNLNNLSFFYGDILMYKDKLEYQFNLDNKYGSLLKWG